MLFPTIVVKGGPGSGRHPEGGPKKNSAEEIARGWKKVSSGDEVSGLIVGSKIANQDSIAASLIDYETIGVREVPIDIFTLKPGNASLANEIKESGRIDPLIVVVDGHPDGMAYILEGSHRIDALKYLGVKSFPALVVLDKQGLEENSKKEKAFTGKQNVTMPFTLQDLINELNIDLTKEYQAMIQYIQHAACLTGPAMLNVAEELRKHADDEHEHAVLISDHINYLGGIPVAVSDVTLTSHDSTQMLTYDIQSEQTAITRYTERVSQAMGLGEFGTMELIQGILEDEQGHENDLMVVLNVKRGK